MSYAAPSQSSAGFCYGVGARIQAIAPGAMLAVVLALAASYVAGRLGGPVILYALLFGMVFNFLAKDEVCQTGIAFSAKSVLRVGVALLGARITLSQIADLGLATILLVVTGVVFTIVGGAGIGRVFKLKSDHAVLSAGAVAICGASAALAISAVLPQTKTSERNTCLTVVGVTTLSTIAMVLYPAIAQGLGLSDTAAGIFLGATIHDVAQVVGAGYMISDVAGETAAITKLMRVSCLVPAVMIIGIVFRKRCASASSTGKTPPLLPLFLVGFVVLVAVNSLGLVPVQAVGLLTEMSRWCLVIAVAALGVKTSLKDFIAVGPNPIAVLVAQTLALAIFGLAGLMLIMPFLS
ncbi:MAG: putative sulfate exporter family transporter [Pseudomonadota bacterium]